MSQSFDSFRGVIIGSPETVHPETVLVEIFFTTKFPADAADSIEEIMQVFAKAGSLGMFAGITFDPARSNVEARLSEPTESTLRYTLSVEAIEFGAFRVLYNMFLRLQRLGMPLSKLVARCSSGRTTTRTLDEIRYCRAPQDLFPWTVEDVPKFHKNRVIEAAFRTPLDDARTDFIFAGVSVWDALMRLDGYALLDSIGSGDNFTADETYLQHPTLLEHGVIWFIADETAYEALVNFFRRVQNMGTSVLSFRVH